MSGPGDAGELLDARAKADYRRRLRQLEAEIEDAAERGDRAGVVRLEDEREALARELARAVGLGGRDRRAVGSPSGPASTSSAGSATC
ncbi:MAG TPA: hypothetical protein VMK12_08975 [Anaeromyxobacteraceae bacterium]|nr:hypothetical protein [Anaeromyxobacteraceae bacterium]